MSQAISSNPRPFAYLTARRVELLERLSRSRSDDGVQVEGPDKRTALELGRCGLVTINREQAYVRIEADGRATLRAFKKFKIAEAPNADTRPVPDEQAPARRRSRRP